MTFLVRRYARSLPLHSLLLGLAACSLVGGSGSSFLSGAELTVDPATWSHWRGPTGNGVAPEASPPTQFSATDGVKWKVMIGGSGSGSPVVWGQRVFVTTAVPAGAGGGQLQFQLRCYDRATGELIWNQTAITARPHEPTHSTNTFASASPCTDGQLVYAPFGSRGLYAYTLDGELVWERNDFGLMRMRNGFGEGSSPVLHQDRLILPWDHEGQSKLYSIDKSTGETVWVVNRDEPSCWATPLVIETSSGTQIIMNGQNRARAYDWDTGREIWSCGGQTQRPVACPVSDGRLVFIGSGFRGSFLGAFDPRGRGRLEGTSAVAWSVSRDTPDLASLLLSEGRLYYFKAKTGILTCVDAATGSPHYKTQRVPGVSTLYASPVAAGGFIYITGRRGNITVIRDAPTFEVIAENSMGETIDATPAAIDNELFIRGQRHLFCIQ